MNIGRILETLCETGASFHARGYAFGSTGNLSVRVGREVWITPTGGSLRNLRPRELARIDLEGKALDERRASKEYPFHLAAYRAAGERAGAVVHLHAAHAVALSCLRGLDPAAPLPVFTPYYLLMRVAPLAVLPYYRPGSPALAQAVGKAAASHDCMLLASHGSICLGATIEEAADRAEELEQTARLFFLIGDRPLRRLTEQEQAEITRVFRAPKGSAAPGARRKRGSPARG